MTTATEPSLAAEPEIIVGSREQALHLLAEAAEIEHTLMCSYLYAVFSLKRAGTEGVTAIQGKALERWRKAILNVAIEEMGHLALVANLTVAIGGPPHFGRPNFPVTPGYFPSGVSVRLVGFSVETLDHFIFLERPRGVAGEDSEIFEQDDYSREHAQPGLMPSAQDYATIGHLYEAIRVNLIGLDQNIGSNRLFVGDPASQVDRHTMDLSGIKPVRHLTEALAAIDIIVEQGEGSPADRDDSHYRSFLTIREELETLTKDDPTFAPAWPVADSPVLRQPPEPEGKVFINHPAAVPLLDFACATYGLLLRCLVQCFGQRANDQEPAKKALMSAAIELMHVLGEAGTGLAQLPASAQANGPHAGMTFTMLRSVEALQVGRVEQRLLMEQAVTLTAAAHNLSTKIQDALKRASKFLRSLGGDEHAQTR